MKITFISEDHPHGLEVEWPAVPATGDFVAFKSRGGTSTQSVERVEWECDGNGIFDKITVYLTY